MSLAIFIHSGGLLAINSNLDLMFKKYVLELKRKLIFIWIKNRFLSASGKKACLAKGIWYLHYSHVPFLQGFQRVFYRLLLVLIQEFFVCRTRRAISPIFLAHTLRRHNTQRYIHATQFNIITYTGAETGICLQSRQSTQPMLDSPRGISLWGRFSRRSCMMGAR